MTHLNYEHHAKMAIKKLMANPDISDKNKTDFQEYMDGIDVKPARQQIIAIHIRHIFKELPDVVGTMDDRKKVNKAFKNIKANVSEGYYEGLKKVGKAFVRWHNKGQTPEGWIDIKGNGKKQKRDLTPEDMITWQDGLKLAKASRSLQWKALILTQLDGGFRPTELFNLSVGDITIKSNMAIARVKDGKTGKRDVILFRCVPALQRWIREHPGKKDDPLWIQEHRTKNIQRYGYGAVRNKLIHLAELIKLDKPVDLYNFRHSACYLSKMDNINTELAARKFGHSVEYYTQTYGRLSADDDLKRYKKHYRMSEEKDKEEEKPITCDRCQTVNEPGITRCEKCQAPLTKEEAMKDSYETVALKEQMAQLIAQMASQQQILAALQKK